MASTQPSAEQQAQWQEAYRPVAAAAVADLLATVQASSEQSDTKAA